MRAVAVRALDVVKWIGIAAQTVYSLYAIVSGALTSDLGGGLLRAFVSYVVLVVAFLPWAALRAVLEETKVVPIEEQAYDEAVASARKTYETARHNAANDEGGQD
jgi:hypothetical protein